MPSYFVVQSFSSGKGGVLPDSPFQAQNIDHARRMARRMAQTKAMVVAFMREGNPKTGDYGDPKLIYAHGENLPEEVASMERA
jgi:hypothetical protein